MIWKSCTCFNMQRDISTPACLNRETVNEMHCLSWGERKASEWQHEMAFINHPLLSSSQLRMADIAVCLGPAGLYPRLIWPCCTTPQGNNSWLLWVLAHMLCLSRPPRVSRFPHRQLSSCTDVRALSQFTLTLFTICFSLRASSWVRV